MKSPKDYIYLYEDRVAPALGVNLKIETWGNGRGGLMYPFCSYNNFDIKSILYLDFGNISYKYTKDNSKFGIGEKNDWVCIGDLNRMEP